MRNSNKLLVTISLFALFTSPTILSKEVTFKECTPKAIKNKFKNNVSNARRFASANQHLSNALDFLDIASSAKKKKQICKIMGLAKRELVKSGLNALIVSDNVDKNDKNSKETKMSLEIDEHKKRLVKLTSGCKNFRRGFIKRVVKFEQKEIKTLAKVYRKNGNGGLKGKIKRLLDESAHLKSCKKLITKLIKAATPTASTKPINVCQPSDDSYDSGYSDWDDIARHMDSSTNTSPRSNTRSYELREGRGYGGIYGGSYEVEYPMGTFNNYSSSSSLSK